MTPPVVVLCSIAILWVSWILAGLWHRRAEPASAAERVDGAEEQGAPTPAPGWKIRAAFWLAMAAAVFPTLHTLWHTLATLFGLPCP